MEKALVVLLPCLAFFGANAQQVDSCEQIRLRWADTTSVLLTFGDGIDPGFYTPVPFTSDLVWRNPSGGYTEYRTRYFPETKPTPKITLWANTTVVQCKSYRITNSKLLGFAVLGLAGAVDGIVEGNDFRGRTAFEDKFNAKKSGYWGSESWRRAYKNGDPEQGYRNLYTRTFGANDFYHHADDARKIGYISGGVIVGLSGANQKWWHYAVDLGLSFIVSGTCKAAGMFWIRN